MPPLGIRLNNPCNLVHVGRNKWQGLADPPNEGRFCRFISPAFGIRAAALNVIAYQDRHGIHTIKALVEKWAPISENDTASYVRSVAKRSGYGATTPLDFHSYSHLRPVIEAMIWHENGVQPYSGEVIDEGLRRAGVVDRPAPISHSTAGRGGQIAATSTAANVGLETAWQTVDSARDAIAQAALYVDCLKYLLLALTMLGVGMMLWPLIKGQRAAA
jgi:hypothetical protein